MASPYPNTSTQAAKERTNTMSKSRDNRKSRAARRHRARKVAGVYWFTPRVWRRSCSHCGGEGSAAYRPRDRKYACEDCIARLGIHARESKGWREGGGRAGAKVTVRRVDDSA